MEAVELRACVAQVVCEMVRETPAVGEQIHEPRNGRGLCGPQSFDALVRVRLVYRVARMWRARSGMVAPAVLLLLPLLLFAEQRLQPVD